MITDVIEQTSLILGCHTAAADRGVHSRTHPQSSTISPVIGVASKCSWSGGQR